MSAGKFNYKSAIQVKNLSSGLRMNGHIARTQWTKFFLDARGDKLSETPSDADTTLHLQRFIRRPDLCF